MALPEVGPSLHAGDGMLFAWHREPIASWQTEAWLAEMRRSLRPAAFARMIQNEFVSAESQFVDMSAWDACVQPTLTPTLERLPVYVGIDASTKRDSTALVAVSFDKKIHVFVLSPIASSYRRPVIPSTSRRQSRRRCSTGVSDTSCDKFCLTRSRWRAPRNAWPRRWCRLRNFRRPSPI